ncbi:type I secretion system permease/ATPase [Ideonella sp. DXS29W]|uniref:Type I secretion system permease/ATPase n=1 Tax=Ideonella lacteola TaxID=2984193 RepID=A0ABU9BQP6_9BURK
MSAPARSALPEAESSLQRFVRPHLKWALGFSLVINLALLTPSLFMLQVYDRVLVTRSVETLVMLLLLAGFSLAVFGAMDQIRTRLLTMLGMSLERRYGPGLLGQLIVANARQSSVELADGLKDLSSLRTFLSGPGVVALFDTPWAIVYLVIIAFFDPRLGVLATLAALILLALTWANNRLVRQGLAQIQDASRATARWADRCMQNAEVVTALGMGEAMTQRWAAQSISVQEATLAATSLSGKLAAISRTARQGVQVLMLSAGAWLVIREGATPGVMIATTIILGRALAPVEQLIGGWQSLVEARLAHRRLQALLDRPVEGQVSTSLPMPTGRLDVESLSHAAPQSGRVLLRQVSFKAEPGELVAVVGGSGAGKTTLARLLVGVLKASGGTVRLDGADIRQYDPRALGAALGYLPQDVELFAGTVAENIARFTSAESSQVVAAAQAAGAHELILRFPQGYDTPVGEGGRLLSGGQRQRVALARALFGEPALVVLDEPDASLDADGEEALMAALQRLRARGATVVAVTQRRRLLSVADRVLVLRDGAIERTAVRRGGGADMVADPELPQASQPMPTGEDTQTRGGRA